MYELSPYRQMRLLKKLIFFVTVYFSCIPHADVILVMRSYVRDLQLN